MIDLNKITPEIQQDLETIWFTADLHHGHPKIVGICNRPVYLEQTFIEELKNKHKDDPKWDMIRDPEWKRAIDPLHNEWLVKEVVNKWVGKKHTLFLIGDCSMAKRSEAEKFLDRLNGNKFLIIGNHDKNIDNSTRFSQTTLRKDFTYSRFGLNIHIVLDHFPLLSWNRKVHGSWHLFGHVHGRLQTNVGLSFDIGIDNPELHKITGGVHRPLNLFEVIKLMNEKYKIDVEVNGEFKDE